MPKRGQNISIENRAQIVAFIKAGRTYAEISKEFGTTKGACSKLWKKYLETRSVRDRKRNGRPTVQTKNLKKRVDHILKYHPDLYASEIRARLPARNRPSVNTIRVVRRRLGYSASKGKPYDQLTQNQKESRLKYCRRHLKDQFTNVIFSDEKPFELFKRYRKNWRKRGHPAIKTPTTKYPPRIQVWAAISKFGKSEITIWKGRQNSKFYTDRLEETLLPYIQDKAPARYRFSQDKDTTHTSRHSRQWLNLNVQRWFEIPTKSPDLNPIELVWHTLEKRFMDRNPKTEKQLKRYIKEEWKSLDQKVITSSINHMIELLPQIIENGGDYVVSKRSFRR